VLALVSGLCYAQSPDYEHQRQVFLGAEKELRSGAGPQYRSLRRQLDGYPLAIYLDYEILRERLRKATPEQALEWLQRADGSPLENRLRAAWIVDHGRRERWRALLAVQPEEPRDAELQCYYYRARLAQGDTDAAWSGAQRLWNVGKSQHRACDPLFNAWMGEVGTPDDALIWSRALKAFDARSAQLLRYLTRFASPELLPLLQELYAVYRRPDTLVTDAHQPSARHAQLMTVGIRRLARVNPERGLAAFDNASPVQPFSDQQIQAIEAMIARHSLFAQSAAPNQWLQETLDRLRDDELTEIYLRNCIKAGAWDDLLTGLNWLSQSEAESDIWRYWRARALHETGSEQQANVLWQALAGERSYHGFLAADRVGASYRLNHSAMEAMADSVDEPGLERVRELMALRRLAEARGEWQLLLLRLPAEQQRRLAVLAREEGWDSFAIAAVNAAKFWDALDSRFPWLYREDFERVASDIGVDAGELIAIARRESALYPGAISPVGALGLMQLMPGTARQVARQSGVSYRRSKLLQPDYNISLGARYYRDLRQRFDELRPMALAAYNAGPHRVDRWTEGSLAVDQWVDSLPFRETREYVRAVLAYALIYRLRDGQPARLLSSQEMSHRY
jgi:soluble lytic murein transglycosylase